ERNARPPGPANTPMLQICYTSPQLYRGVPDAAFYCQAGYVYAYNNRQSINNSRPPSQQQPTLSEESREACVNRGNIPGASNQEALTQACQHGYEAAKNGKTKQQACRSGTYIGVEITYCEKGYDLARPSGGAGSNDAAGDESGSCEGQGLSFGWVICGLTELVSGFGQIVFKDYIQPLMEDNPISLETDDPFYKSWQGFRFLGNIMLIGSMLAIVYSQARGGGGGQ
ncbi:MAG TPA: hypothetical protein VFX86_04125, partial [Candidatus Saccharimonadales bacterium]|nr:hypothetical protein [Candidatus Saccharimonadales bacterium]